uniref:glucose-6-phosphate 1-epimerase n=1 Tax=Pinguiococcus pyrenoidosus TaxID=172671 RepID=A0A7R9UBK7_9STRA|mmetsp:Transcript_3499/g.13835  ORF Transcript_3499/g.13835 Transcript_3499/m.13835 type:complete len:301 (+) Transcript_3499:69-971(+)
MAELVTGNGDMEMVRMVHPSGSSCEVYLFGASVTKFSPASAPQRNMLWVSSDAKYNNEKSIRGGIPLVFPQFGRPDERMAQHGFVRNSKWNFAGSTTEGDELVSSFVITHEDATHEAWPYKYELQFDVRLAPESLTTVLNIKNTGDEEFGFQCLQHPYFNVGDITETRVIGFQGCSYFDKVTGELTNPIEETREVVDVTQETDRIFCAPIPDPILVKCPAGDFEVSKSAKIVEGASEGPLSPDTVFWNPWIDTAAGMSDFNNDGYLEMLCVEPGLVNGKTQLPPGAIASLTQVVRPALEA